jgi:ubiquitin carboxyl-terminal hydrolase 8
MSAEQLLDRMVISPENEQEMFINRDEFDLVVYYDDGTQSETFLTKPTSEHQERLKYLYEALHDFNDDKPLRRPPILLMGGIEAWAGIVGNQALATSETVSKVKQGRPIQRRPVPGGQMRVPKRRLREYNPLDEDEERKWRERARAESVVLPTPTVAEEDEEALTEEPEGDDEMPYSAIEDFNQRFPDAGQLDKYAFGPLQPKRAAPEPPPKLPLANYPAAPPVSQYPSVPARPMPAAPRTSYTGVSDRAGSQNVPAARSSSLVPYIPAKYLSSSFKLPQTGLDNFGVTCYMNSTLQAFSATKALSIFFMEDAFRKHLQRDNWKGTNGIMPELYANLIKSLWKNDVTYVRPSTFRRFCGRQNSQWMNDRQEQDAKEFFDFLVDCLHEDLNVKWSRNPLKELTRQEEAKRERMPKSVVAMVEWQRYTHRNHSFPLTLFGGQYSSLLRFSGCGHTSTTHEAFFALSVEIPLDIRNRRLTLDDCLHSFCATERLDPSERAKCDQCNERKDSTKQLTITRAPQFLVIHFKRFKTTRNGTRKIDAPIHFPLENFDLAPFMLPPPSSSESEIIARDYGAEYVRPDASMVPPYTYSAYAVIRHLGDTIERGHYKCLVRDLGRGTWKCFNDRYVSEVDGRDLGDGRAYIVFYQRNSSASAAVGGGGPMGPGGVGKI